jgi:small subunit ribosomal protein S1
MMTAQPGAGDNDEGDVMENKVDNLRMGDRPGVPDEPDESWWTSLLMDEPQIEEQMTDIEPRDLDEKCPKQIDQIVTTVNWAKISSLYKNDDIIALDVVDFNQGGVLVENGDVKGFVPASHLIDLPVNICDEDREYYLTSYLDRKISLKVIECEPKKERVVFSERAALAGAGQRKELLQSLTEGDIVSGTVTNITSFGVFVDLGGVEGLIHISELSWGRVQHPSRILSIGENVETMVIEIFEKQGRIALSLKQLERNPWDSLSKKLSPGDIVDAEISSIEKYGAFARLHEGIEGLIHVSSMTIPEDCNNIDDFLFEGLPVKVGVISIDPDNRRLGLKLESY